MFEVIITPSGAHAMYDHASGETMHPGAGPLLESQRLYVQPSRLLARLEAAARESLVVLDVGLGAGSNAAAAWSASETRRGRSGARSEHAQEAVGRRLELVSFDHTLQALRTALQPAHATRFGFDGAAAAAAQQLLRDGYCTTSNTHWRLCLGDVLVELAREPAASADIVFWDPFSARANPGLWTVAAFRTLRRVCRPGATVHTYSGATATRAALLLAGFAVGYGDAAAGKQKHSTVAAVCVDDLARPLDRSWLERFARAKSAWPVDAPHTALEQLATSAQFA